MNSAYYALSSPIVSNTCHCVVPYSTLCWIFILWSFPWHAFPSMTRTFPSLTSTLVRKWLGIHRDITSSHHLVLGTWMGGNCAAICNTVSQKCRRACNRSKNDIKLDNHYCFLLKVGNNEENNYPVILIFWWCSWSLKISHDLVLTACEGQSVHHTTISQTSKYYYPKLTRYTISI